MDNIMNDLLPNYSFMVVVPSIATYTAEEVEIYGLPTRITNNEKLDKHFNEMSTVYLPLYKIIEIYNQGFPIKLVRQDEIDKVYGLLEEYLNKVGDLRDNTIHKLKFDQNKLEEIDRFASEVFNLNKRQIVNNVSTFKNGWSIGLNKDIQPQLDQFRSLNNVSEVKLESVSRFDNSRYDFSKLPNRQFTPDNGEAFNNYNNTEINRVGYTHNNAPVINFDNISRTSRYRMNKGNNNG